MEFRDTKVARETQYFGDPFEPGASRAQWVEPDALKCLCRQRSAPGREDGNGQGCCLQLTFHGPNNNRVPPGHGAAKDSQGIHLVA